MFNSNVIDVAIGLVFIFLLLSLICSAAHELIEVLLKQRAANLEKGIQELAGENGQDFVTKLYRHGLINSLYAGTYVAEAKGLFQRLINRYFKGQDLPSYIPAENFALALIDLWKTHPEVLPQNVKDALQSFVRVAGQDAALLQQHIETWFNSSMDRVSGWYKRRSQWIVMVLGVALTVAVNADSIYIAKRLSTNSNLRQSVEQLAESAVKEMPPPTASQPAGAASQTTSDQSTAVANPAASPAAPTDGAATSTAAGANPTATTASQPNAADALKRIQGHLSMLDAIGLPIGRDYSLKSPKELWGAARVHWLGWLLTALAVSLGAPFWFDVLNKIIVVRSTVKPHEKSGAEASKDARSPQPPAPAAEVQVVVPDAAAPDNPALDGGQG